MLYTLTLGQRAAVGRSNERKETWYCPTDRNKKHLKGTKVIDKYILILRGAVQTKRVVAEVLYY